MILLAFGSLAACATDSTLTSNEPQETEDAASTDDTANDDDHVLPDVREHDVSSGADTTDASAEGDASETADGGVNADDAGALSDASDAAESDTDEPDAQDPDGSCYDDQDCQANGGGSRVEPGGFAGCGSCTNYLVTCTEDSECGQDSADFVCERVAPEDCSCSPDISICKPACQASSDCDEGQSCNSDGHCVATSCSTSDASARTCPPNFTCKTHIVCTANGDCQTCERMECDQDADCDASNRCVNGECHTGPGSCELPRP